MATATAEMAKVVRRVLDEELGDDSEALLKGIQRVTRLLTDQVIPKLGDDADTEEPTPMPPPSRRATKPMRSASPTPGHPGRPSTPDHPSRPESPDPDKPPPGDLPEEAVAALEALARSLSPEQSQALATLFTALSEASEDEGDTDQGGLAMRGTASDALTTYAQPQPEAFQAAVDALTPYVAEEDDGTFSLAAPKRVISTVDADAYAALTEALDQANQLIRDDMASAVGVRGIKIPWKLIWQMCRRLGKVVPWFKVACAMAVVIRNHSTYPGDPPQRRWLEAAARNVMRSCL
jgi:hypothetical protein